MSTVEHLPDGKVQLNILTPDGWIRHIFDSIETLEKYAPKCYDFQRELGHG